MKASTKPAEAPSPIPTKAALIDLASRICACGCRKTHHHTFCGPDYHRLPVGMCQALYDRVGEGYEQAYANALAFLRLESPELKRLAARATESEAGK
jgi:hypothetical protein